MKIIDLLVKISKGEEAPKKIRIDHWCYTFEWVEHLHNYYDEDCDIDLSSALSLDIEELNYGVEIIEEEKEISKMIINEEFLFSNSHSGNMRREDRRLLDSNFKEISNKINELIDVINDMRDKEC